MTALKKILNEAMEDTEPDTGMLPGTGLDDRQTGPSSAEPTLEPEDQPVEKQLDTPEKAGGSTVTDRGDHSVGSPESTRAAPRSDQSSEDSLQENLAPHPAAVSPRTGPSEKQAPVSLRHTDHQEQVQDLMRTGGSSSSTTLPRTRFVVRGQDSQPLVRSLPEALLLRLRSELRSAAVRQLGTTDAEARGFAESLSQGALVIAFVMAGLDLRLDLDKGTLLAADLFGSRDPLLGSINHRMGLLEDLVRSVAATGESSSARLRELDQGVDVATDLLAFTVADRAENLFRGVTRVDDVRLGHDSVQELRSRAEATTKTRRTREREQTWRAS